jgi:hypothetical protein
MEHPQVSDRGDSLHIWRVAEDVLNKQLVIASNGWPSSTQCGMKCYTGLQTWTDSLDQFKRWKMDVRCGT